MADKGKDIANPTKLGKVTDRGAIAKAMYADAKEVFMKNLDELEKEYTGLVKIYSSDSQDEKYETVGNLKPAYIKGEGEAITYGTITDGWTTKLKNNTIVNGFAVTFENQQDDKWGLINKTKGSELARTMNDFKELACAETWDKITETVGADGVPGASHKHPLLQDSTKFNDNLVENEFNTDTYIEATKRFNHWFNHYGSKFQTKPDTIIAHSDRQVEIAAMLQSTLWAFENTNTKNTIPKLSVVFNSYIKELPVHILDSSISSVILQERMAMQTNYSFDESGTLDYYFNAVERYQTGVINPGFGFVTITGEKSV